MMKQSAQRGFTLLEMIVAVGLFSIVMVIVTGAYLSLVALDRQARATSSTVSNLSFALDSMTRALRTGRAYNCGSPIDDAGNCPAGGNSMSYTDSSGQTVTYLLKSDGTIGQCTTTPCLQATATSLTDPSITVQSLTFYIRGGGVGDNLQPQVTIVMKGTMPTGTGTTATFDIQTSATQRLLEI